MHFRALAIVAGIAAAVASSATLAHHSNAMFDIDKVTTVTGTVRDFQWTNPHCFIELVVDDPKGQQDFSIETGAPGVLRRQGWKFNSLKAGDKVVAKIHPLRDGRLGGGLISISVNGVQVGTSASTFGQGSSSGSSQGNGY
jgi:Family of unknown function (DUF6152)